MSRACWNRRTDRLYQLVSVDGAMVPLVGGIGLDRADGSRLGLGQDPTDPTRVRTEALSYFSRLSDDETFTRLATLGL